MARVSVPLRYVSADRQRRTGSPTPAKGGEAWSVAIAARTGAATIRAILVDDEPLALRKLRRLVAAEREWRWSRRPGGTEAAEAIRGYGPDLVFLDIQIPELDGFEVLDTLGRDELPVIVFVTAYDEYALRAFDAHALDYLLKPVAREPFRETLGRARDRCGSGARPV